MMFEISDVLCISFVIHSLFVSFLPGIAMHCGYDFSLILLGISFVFRSFERSHVRSR